MKSTIDKKRKGGKAMLNLVMNNVSVYNQSATTAMYQGIDGLALLYLCVENG